jgi:hypothetical protein
LTPLPGDAPLGYTMGCRTGFCPDIEWYIYEQDSGEGSPFDYAAASYEFLEKNLP